MVVHHRLYKSLPSSRNAMKWYRTDMAVIAFAITLATFFLSGYFQLSATQASARALHGLFNNDRIYHHRHAIHGGVASESSVCSQIGIDLLRIGGNAADAVCSFLLVAFALIYVTAYAATACRYNLLYWGRW